MRAPTPLSYVSSDLGPARPGPEGASTVRVGLLPCSTADSSLLWRATATAPAQPLPRLATLSPIRLQLTTVLIGPAPSSSLSIHIETFRLSATALTCKVQRSKPSPNIEH
ncbi:hypothetical protein C8Q74DRAFT_795683 [Fomes fomentarius]|nr:hypothetical protein C8Q74DRAFT_795683 [Fomes fomentarius]